MIDFTNREGQVVAKTIRPPMDLNVEHKFELVDVSIQENVATKYGPKTKIKFVFQEDPHSMTGKYPQRVYVNFNESYFEESNLMQFLKKISRKQISPGTTIKLGDHIVVGMRIIARVQMRLDKATGASTGFYDFVMASVRFA